MSFAGSRETGSSYGSSGKMCAWALCFLLGRQKGRQDKVPTSLSHICKLLGNYCLLTRMDMVLNGGGILCFLCLVGQETWSPVCFRSQHWLRLPESLEPLLSLDFKDWRVHLPWPLYYSQTMPSQAKKIIGGISKIILLQDSISSRIPNYP